MGVAHRIVASRHDEADVPGLAPADLARAHAVEKAREVAARAGVPRGGGVLGADTVVVVGDRVLGKPDDRDDAARMLDALGGRRHSVVTAVCLVVAGGEHVFADEAGVTFRPLHARLVDWYLDRGEWQGRAGGYAIQGSGAVLVDRVDGDFTTVVGLPVGRLSRLLEDVGLADWGPPADRGGPPPSGPAHPADG